MKIELNEEEWIFLHRIFTRALLLSQLNQKTLDEIKTKALLDKLGVKYIPQMEKEKNNE